MNVNFVVVEQVSPEDEWNIYLTDKKSFSCIGEYLSDGDTTMLKEALHTAEVYDMIAQYECKEVALEIVREYADSHLVTIYMEVPLLR